MKGKGIMKSKQKGLDCVSFKLQSELYKGQGTVTAATLYDTLVARIIVGIDKGEAFTNVFLNHGGWVTRSTCKAINTALKQAGVPGQVSIKKGEMIAVIMGNKPAVIPSSGLGLLV